MVFQATTGVFKYLREKVYKVPYLRDMAKSHKYFPPTLKPVFHTQVCVFFLSSSLQPQDSLNFPTVIPVAFTSREVSMGSNQNYK